MHAIVGEHDMADVARTAANRRRHLAVRYGMLHTALCDSLAIDVPIIVAPFGPWAQVDLAVATAEAGCLASLGTAVRTVSELEDQWREMRSRTDRPFAINHTGRPFVEEVFAATLDAAPAAISFHMPPEPRPARATRSIHFDGMSPATAGPTHPAGSRPV